MYGLICGVIALDLNIKVPIMKMIMAAAKSGVELIYRLHTALESLAPPLIIALKYRGN